MFYWVAFNDLSSERQIGMGLGPIPRSAIMAYAAESGLYGDAAEHFAIIIRMVDVEYMRITNSTSKDSQSSETTAQVDDVEGTKQVLSRLAARASTHFRPQQKKPNGQS